jgi:hypothetical protein
MTETRAERTDYLGLLALYNADGRSQGWGWPYWNQLIVDAFLAALADAPRTGVELITSPDPPTLNAQTTGGYLLADVTYEVVQTFVDDYGRETLASTVASEATTGAIEDPDTAATLAAESNASGFTGGLFEVWYTWTDANSRETLPSPVVSTQLPYLALPAYNKVTVTLPATPASVGAAGANIYIRQNNGRPVLASMIITDTETEAELTGTIANCSVDLPTVNNTGATASLEITGASANGSETPAYTRFYIRIAGQTWTASDRRLKLGGVDQWDPDTVTYPLTFTGAVGEIVPGYPPDVSQVKAIRKIDLATETVGVSGASAADIISLTGTNWVTTNRVAQMDTPGMGVQCYGGTAVSDEAIWHVNYDASVSIAAAHSTNPRIDIVCVNDAGIYVSSADDAACKGTAAGSPAAPETPEHYVLIAEVAVAANETEILNADITAKTHGSRINLDRDTLGLASSWGATDLEHWYPAADMSGGCLAWAYDEAQLYVVDDSGANNVWAPAAPKPLVDTITDITTDMAADANDNELKGKINDILGALRDAGLLDT